MENKKIKRYSLPYTKKDINFVLKHTKNILQKGYLTDGGEYVKLFEEKWQKIIGTKHSIAVNSCTTALELILKCIDVKNSSVIVPTYTFFATPLSAHAAGAEVVYADINKNTMSLSLNSIKEVVRPDTKAIIIVHVGGIISSEITLIREWCDQKGIFLVEDAACAHGASHNGVKVGNFGHFAAFSFHHSKVLTSGEGGMITTNNDEYARKIKRMRAIGLDREINNWEVFELGNNYKLPETSAVLGLLHCNKSKKIFEERRNIAKFYNNNIKFNNNLNAFVVDNQTVSGYYKYVVMAKSLKYKKKFISTLNKEYGIELPPNIYDYMCHTQKINDKIKNSQNCSFENAKYMMDHNVCLPMYCGLQIKDLEYITESINKIIC